jgi:plastocyanin
VHTAALQLAPILGAEKSKVPFYIAGGVLVAWALIVSVGLGMRRPDFPGSLTGQRIVGTITAVLVVIAASMAVITSGSPAKGAPSAAATSSTAAAPAPAASTPAASTPAASTPKSSPKATTGTPAPPSSPAAAPEAVSKLTLAANPRGELSYNTKQLSAKAGKVTIEMANMSPVEHNVTIAKGTTVLGATPTFVGGTKTVTVSLKPGTYTFFCSVPGHRQAGMEGTLTVS